MSTPNNFDLLRLVLSEPNPQSRQNIRSGLFSQGLRNVEATSNLDAALNASKSGNLDILLVDLSVGGDDPNKFLTNMRHGNNGQNPFSVAIAFTDNPTPDVIHRASDAGFDDILIKPFSLADLQARLNRFLGERKPFVVTSEYIGPDRRSELRKDTKRVPLLTVPNPVQMIAIDGMSREEMHAEVRVASSQINEQKVERLGDQIVWLADRLVPELKAGNFSETTDEMVKRLLSTSIDIGERLAGTGYAHVAELCEAVTDVANRIAKNPKAPKIKDLSLLDNLASAVQSAFNVDEETVDIAHDIKSSVLGDKAKDGKK